MFQSNNISIFKVFHEAMRSKKGGEVVVRCGAETGRVFFVGGKIAWAAVSTIKRTFTSFLVDQTPLTAEEIQEVFEECKRNNKKFAETVVEWGLLNLPTMRSLLLQHFTECLYDIFSWPIVECMFMPEEKIYNETLTFEFEEALSKVIELDNGQKLSFGKAPIEEILREMEKMVTKPSKDTVSSDGGSNAPELKVAKGKGRGFITGVIVFVVVTGLGLGAFFWLKSKEASNPSNSPSESGFLDGNDTSASAEPGLIPESKLENTLDGSTTPESGRSGVLDGDAISPDSASPEPSLRIGYGIRGDGWGSLRVLSNPSKAIIYLDGVLTGRSTPYTMKKVASGVEHLIVVEKKGFFPTLLRVGVSNEQNKKIKLTLKRQGKKWSGKITVRVVSDPPDASIIINGRPIPQKTPADVELSLSKTSKLVLNKTGFRPWKRIIRPVPKVDLTLHAVLKK